jgi:hypothetical protein
VAVTEWLLGDDDPLRPHPLRVMTPNATVDERDDQATLRRREQSLFDRRAVEGGFVVVVFSGRRWFSRSPVFLSGPDRSVGRYDVRAPAVLDDATRADLARDTKQTLTYAAVAAALVKQPPFDIVDPMKTSPDAFGRAIRGAVEPLARLAGYQLIGADPLSLEPMFEGSGGALITFDDLPTFARHLISFGALTTRALFAAYPGRDARQVEGVILIDDADLHLDPAMQRGLVPALRESVPGAQWLLATASPAITLGCGSGDVLALRRMPASNAVELYSGDLAVVH